MRIKPCILGLAVLVVAPAWGEMYEWRDPETGKLKLGDRPPSSVQYWKEGERKPGEQVAKPAPPPQIREATEDEVRDCLGLLRNQYSFKDPESLRIEGKRLALVHENGNKIITISVNGKNSYGAYAGTRTTICQYETNGSKKLVVYEEK